MIPLIEIGVTKSKQGQFAKKGVFCVEDLAQYLPRRYSDYTKDTGLLPETEVSVFTMRSEFINEYRGSKVPIVRIAGVVHGTGDKIAVSIFNQPWMFKKLYSAVQMHADFLVAGKVSYSYQYGYSVSAPEYFEPYTDGVRKIRPVYSKISGMSNDYLSEKIELSLQKPAATADPLPFRITSELGVAAMGDALLFLHKPRTMEDVEAGTRRMLYNDLIYFALQNEYADKHASEVSPVKFASTDMVKKLHAALPYSLTDDQADTLNSLIDYANRGRRINALVQGDVGCGKTIVAISAMVAAAENGYQAAIMAPTQVLARQHYEELCRLTEPLGFKVVFLGSGMKAAEKKDTLKLIADGTANFVVGTHSVISESVKYHNLGLTVADEEHRFGVLQRAALVKKAESGVHNITMSATPIPRTLAQVVYGEALQLYSIKTMPAGRKPVITGISTTQDKIYQFIIREARKGHQTYVVCPLIEQSEKMEDVKSVEEVTRTYTAALVPYGIRIATLTGRDSKADTEKTIADFKDGKIDVLISTTVVEVGVNVPTATLMVISNAERFGLASLHQLRGRVGRSSLQSYCVLDSDDRSDKAMARLGAMVETTDGFKIAEADLNLRGAGDFIGTRQSGDNKYLSLAIAYPDEYRKAREVARELLASSDSCPMLDRFLSEAESIAS